VSQYCDVALPVPVDRAFTYELGGLEPEVGARVMVPFAGQRLVGVVVGLHDARPEDVEVKRVQQVLDDAALLPDELMELGKWIASYYCAPLGEVLRGMMPLTAEVRRQWVYRIGEQGKKVLHDAAVKGASRRSRLSAEDQNREYAVLNYLLSGEAAKAATIRSATDANKALLDAMARKKWLVREALANEAYGRGDAEALQRILSDYDESSESVQGEGIGAELIRIIRQIHQARKNIAALEEEQARLSTSELSQLKKDAEMAQREGRDLLAQLATALAGKIMQRRKEHEALAQRVDAHERQV